MFDLFRGYRVLQLKDEDVIEVYRGSVILPGPRPENESEEPTSYFHPVIDTFIFTDGEIIEKISSSENA